jgi:hypothetical protein
MSALAVPTPGNHHDANGPRPVFVADFLHLPAAFTDLRPALGDPDAHWLQRLQADDSGELEPSGQDGSIRLRSGALSLEVEVGPSRRLPTVRIRLQVGPPRMAEEYVVTPLSWRPLQLGGVLPGLDGHLELSPSDEAGGWSRLGLYGRYHVPLARAGVTVDRLALHRVAEATMRRLLGAVGDALTAA